MACLATLASVVFRCACGGEYRLTKHIQEKKMFFACSKCGTKSEPAEFSLGGLAPKDCKDISNKPGEWQQANPARGRGNFGSGWATDPTIDAWLKKKKGPE